MFIDFNHHIGDQLGKMAHDNLYEVSMLQMIALLKPTFAKEGDMFCYLYGENLHSGIAGFGSTPYEAMVSFCTAFKTEKAK
jgi:hypothetical protein